MTVDPAQLGRGADPRDTGLLAGPDGARVAAAKGPGDLRSYVTRPGAPGSSSAWSLPKGEVPQQLGPDGSLLVSGTPHADPRGYDVFLRPLVVRDAATGVVRARASTGASAGT